MVKLALTVISAALLAACAPDADPTAPSPQELFTLICVDSVLYHPYYACPPPRVDTVTITITIQNPGAGGGE